MSPGTPTWTVTIPSGILTTVPNVHFPKHTGALQKLDGEVELHKTHILVQNLKKMMQCFILHISHELFEDFRYNAPMLGVFTECGTITTLAYFVAKARNM